MKIQILDIIRGTTVDGPGFRTAIYMAGCRHYCTGCHNPESWDFNAGHSMTLEQIIDVIREEDFDVTLTGGDPLYSPQATKALIDAVTALRHTVWIYTGFTWEEIKASPTLLDTIKGVEAIVEGRFLLARRDTSLRFRGSDNQRIIYL